MAPDGLASGGRASEHDKRLIPTTAAAMTAMTFRNGTPE